MTRRFRALFHILPAVAFLWAIASGAAWAAPASTTETAPAAAYDGPGRVLYVGANSVDEEGRRVVGTVYGSISAAIGAARPGDIVRVAPGEYRESLLMTKPDVSVIGSFSGENEPDVIVTGNGLILKDSQNTLWRGIRFQGGKYNAVELRGFTGRFEHCYFDLTQNTAYVNIYGGRPSFQACSFVSEIGLRSTVNINEHEDETAGAAEFSYCLFRDLTDAAVFLKGEQNLNFINCVFANCEHFLLRLNEIKAKVHALNSIFYLIPSDSLVAQSITGPKTILDNCLYAPAPGPFVTWQAAPLEEQLEIEPIDCLEGSPRFEGGRRTIINLCVDDTANVPLWNVVTGHAEKLGVHVTVSLDTNALSITPQMWDLVTPRANSGHEIASHAFTHSSFLAYEAIRLGYFSDEAESAVVAIDDDKIMSIKVNDEEIFRISLCGSEEMSLQELVQILQETNLFRVELTDLSLRNVPAYLLEATEGQDILFDSYLPSLVLDRPEYIFYMLFVSRNAIETGLRARGSTQTICDTLVCPFMESGPIMEPILEETGFEIVRGQGKKPYVSALEFLNLFELWAVSLKYVLSDRPVASDEEAMRLTLDFFKYHGSIVGLYAHGPVEFTIGSWDKLIELIAADPMIDDMSLKQIAKLVKQYCDPVRVGSKWDDGYGFGGNYGLGFNFLPNRYSCAPDSVPLKGEISFRPKPDSPVWSAGKPNGLSTNFVGEPVSPKTPNIGLY